MRACYSGDQVSVWLEINHGTLIDIFNPLRKIYKFGYYSSYSNTFSWTFEFLNFKVHLKCRYSQYFLTYFLSQYLLLSNLFYHPYLWFTHSVFSFFFWTFYLFINQSFCGKTGFESPRPRLSNPQNFLLLLLLSFVSFFFLFTLPASLKM